jgi:hypothetical protein
MLARSPGVVLLLIGGMLAGCDQLFGLPHLASTTTDAGMQSHGGDAKPDTPAPTCPLTYDLSLTDSVSRYRVGTALATWDAAEVACEVDSAGNTHLAVLDDDNERLALVSALVARGMPGSMWIGLTDRIDEGTYQWVTTQEVAAPPLTTPPWGAGQPDGQADAQDCVRIQGSTGTSPTMFDDSECASSFNYVCECDGYAPVSP